MYSFIIYNGNKMFWSIINLSFPLFFCQSNLSFLNNFAWALFFLPTLIFKVSSRLHYCLSNTRLSGEFQWWATMLKMASGSFLSCALSSKGRLLLVQAQSLNSIHMFDQYIKFCVRIKLPKMIKLVWCILN